MSNELEDEDKRIKIVLSLVVALFFLVFFLVQRSCTSTDKLEEAASQYQSYINSYFDRNSKYPADLSELPTKKDFVVKYAPECDELNVCKKYVLSVTEGKYTAIINSDDRTGYELFEN